MGRNPKQGIDYFPADVDMFQDRKIKRLLRSAGGKGFTIYIYLLTNIYRDKGYFYEWDQHSAFDISDDLNFSENVVEETVRACCSIGLFNEDLYTEKSIISSESIQQRWQKIVTDANRVETDIDPSIKIVGGKPLFLTQEKEKPPEETPEKSGETPQSKVKESKVKERRGESVEAPPDPDYPSSAKFIDEAEQIAQHLLESIIQCEPDHRYAHNPPSLNSWVLEIERAMRLDWRSPEQLRLLIDYIFTQSTEVADFWRPNIESGKKLRQKFDKVVGQIKREIKQRNGHYKQTRGDEFAAKLF